MTILSDMTKTATHASNYCGDFEVIQYEHPNRVLISFINTSFTTYTTATQIRKGEVKDPYVPKLYGKGFLGEGSHKSTVMGKKTKTYSLWTGMLYRCYSGKQPTYKDCEVDTRWLNYQNFCNDLPTLQGYDLYQQGLKKEGRNRIHLDKDILFSGNKLYSRYTCCFITDSENTIEANKRRK